MINELVKSLNKLHLRYSDGTPGKIGIKSSFEDEGVFFNDLVLLKNALLKSDTFFNIKIGGCEAKSDVFNCITLDCDGIVAPMIESEFAIQKYKELIDGFNFGVENKNFYVNIESKSGYQNIDNIIEKGDGFLKGIVVGRSDLTHSFGLTKDKVDSDDIYDIVENIFTIAKGNGLQTGMGGNISVNSIDFISKLSSKGLIDYIETRNVILRLDNSNQFMLKEFIEDAIRFEKLWLDIKSKYYLGIGNESLHRSKVLSTRLSKDDFKTKVTGQEERVISVDFDGVIHNMTKGFHDGTMYGDLIDGVEESLKEMSKDYDLVVYSCKCNPERPLINGKTGTELIWEYLEKHNLKQYIKDVTFNKPNAICYIDDKCLEFKNWKDTIQDIRMIKEQQVETIV